MDQTTKANMLVFFGSILALAAFWLIVPGVTGGSPVRIALGVCAAVASVAVFRWYQAARR